MSQNKSNFKTIKIITYFWIALFVFSLLSIALVMQLDKVFLTERGVNQDKIEMTSLGYILAQKSDHLTSEARNFAVTANPKHLMNYWDEINLNKKREYAVIRLKQLSANEDEITLLAQSKANSDALTLTEVKSMRLVLDAHNVPEKLMPTPVGHYILSTNENNMSPNQKILLAQKILFDDTYKQNKRLIMDPIETFEHKLQKRTFDDLAIVQAKVDMYRLYLISSIAVMSFLIFCIIWLRTLYLK